jgi:hypothetical protein
MLAVVVLLVWGVALAALAAFLLIVVALWPRAKPQPVTIRSRTLSAVNEPVRNVIRNYRYPEMNN